MGRQLTGGIRAGCVAAVFVLAAVQPALLVAQQRDAGEASSGQDPATLTRAESTDFQETSSQADVARVLTALESRSGRLFLTRLGYSEEGRPLHMAVWGAVEGPSAAQVRASGTVRVLVFANIHAGEVAGKEAVLILLRQLVAGSHAEWADSLVLLVVPNYNADGNERVGLRNRRLQHGPTGGMGQRVNASGLDLNRDNMKLESAEARSLVRVLNEYDPHVIMDLHTTNGTVHAYHLTYSPPLHPDTPQALDDLLRSHWLPAVTRSVRDRNGWETFYYGNVPRSRGPEDPPERGWYTFDYKPRFTTNYIGLRNRFGILAEAYAYASFEDRVEATRLFVEEVVDYVYAHAGAVRTVIARADGTQVVGRELTVQATFERMDSVMVLLGEAQRVRNPYTGETMLLRKDVVIPESMPEFGRFAPTETAMAPAAYLIPVRLEGVAELLRAHGIRVSHTLTGMTLEVQEFRIDSVHTAGRSFQGHSQTSVTGEYVTVRREVAPGTLVVRMDQPLARLVFALLEPMAGDGLVNWNFMDSELAAGRPAPVSRVMHIPPELSREDE